MKLGTKLVCVGRNYAAHAAELGNSVPTTPMLFMKPTTCYVPDGGSVILPKISTNVHYEIELGVVIGKKMTKVSKSEALDYVAGYTIAVDVTARDLQEKCKAERSPWLMAKCLDTFCPVGAFISADKIDPANTDIQLVINDKVVQKGNTSDLVFSVPMLLEYISAVITLLPGDVVLTGTPDGVGPLHDGDVLVAMIPGVTEATFNVQAEK